MYKLIHTLTRIKPPSATLLDNMYTNIYNKGGVGGRLLVGLVRGVCDRIS